MRLLIDKEHGGGREKESAEDNVGPAAEHCTKEHWNRLIASWLLYDNTKVCLLVESVSLPLHSGTLEQAYRKSIQ